MKRSIAYFSAAAVFIVVFISLTGFGEKKTSDVKALTLWVELDPSKAEPLQIAIPSFAPLVQKVDDAVLTIRVESKSKALENALPPGFDDNPFFRRFFGDRFENREPQVRQGQGSGFIISADGHALTNYHVIENATSIKIKIGSDRNDDKEYDAEVIGGDKLTDVALIKIKSSKKDWPVIPLGNSSKVKPGDIALAIGNPLGLGLSVSDGIISGLHRKGMQLDGLFDFFQINAPISPGNSGGPLLNLTGEVIGINTAIIDPRIGNSIGFSIPINQVKSILPQLKTKGKASHGWLGVAISEVPEELAKALKLSNRRGALIRQVSPNSPASKAGMEPGDIVTEFNGEAIVDFDDLRQKAVLLAGKSVVAKVLRNEKAVTLTIKLEERPSDDEDKTVSLESNPQLQKMDSIGLSVTTLDDATRKKLDLDKNLHGARILSVAPGSAAATARLAPNDVIFRINNLIIKNSKDLSDLVGNLEKGSYLRVFFARGKTLSFTDLVIP